jgi:hypothetical protein
LLQAAFREVHRYGFQSAAIHTILAATNVTKGALYYIYIVGWLGSLRASGNRKHV